MSEGLTQFEQRCELKNTADEGFLLGVHEKIRVLEYVEKEAERVRLVKKQLFFARCKLIGGLSMFSLLLWCFLPGLMGIEGTVYLWAISVFLLGSGYEYLDEIRSGIYGNRHSESI